MTATVYFVQLIYTHVPELQPNTSNSDSHIPRWDGRYSDSFISNINLDAVDGILAFLRTSDCTKETVNSATDMISNLFQTSRRMSFPIKKLPFKCKTSHVKNKPWFGPQCKTAQRKYHLAKRRYYDTRDPRDKSNLTFSSKEYKKKKKTMDKFL